VGFRLATCSLRNSSSSLSFTWALESYFWKGLTGLSVTVVLLQVLYHVLRLGALGEITYDALGFVLYHLHHHRLEDRAQFVVDVCLVYPLFG